jgi:transcriptional regulator GlxA family with amidase domain
LTAVHRTSTTSARREIWQAATAYIEEHLAADLSLEDVATAAITSERHLQRVFSEVGDTTVRSFIAETRMRRARELMLVSDLPVAAVATAVGYRHASAFIKAFRLHHGDTPAAVRRGM